MLLYITQNKMEGIKVHIALPDVSIFTRLNKSSHKFVQSSLLTDKQRILNAGDLRNYTCRAYSSIHTLELIVTHTLEHNM